MALQIHAHSSTAALDCAFALWVASLLKNGIEKRGRASIVVSGGRTPIGLFEQLRGFDLDWSRVTFTLADERWVAADHADSNERLVREHLLTGKARHARFIPLKFEADTPAAGARLASAALATLDDPFDVVILGMGEDGHTASLFPGSPQISAGLFDASGDACLATENTSKAPRWRITLTAPRLLNAYNIAVHITGAAKWSLLGDAIAGEDIERLPIRFALNQERVPCHVFWCR